MGQKLGAIHWKHCEWSTSLPTSAKKLQTSTTLPPTSPTDRTRSQPPAVSAPEPPATTRINRLPTSGERFVLSQRRHRALDASHCLSFCALRCLCLPPVTSSFDPASGSTRPPWPSRSMSSTALCAPSTKDAASRYALFGFSSLPWAFVGYVLTRSLRDV